MGNVTKIPVSDLRHTTSCLLFHGPGASEAAYKEAVGFGSLLPFTGCDGGLKKEGARDFVELMSHLPVGSGRRSVLLGPLDEITPQVGDVLLKTLEEFDPSGVRPFLWAWDLGGVIPTIRSRCLGVYAPGVDDRLDAFQGEGEKLLRFFLLRDWGSLIEMWKEGEKGDSGLLLGATVSALGARLAVPGFDPRLLDLWDRLRSLPWGGTLTPAMVLSSFIGDGS